jgi:dihydrofolate synthase/folylpolyglutamate synthase
MAAAGSDLATAYAQAVRDIFSNADYTGGSTRYQKPQECWDRFEAMLDHLGRPGAALKLIHIAGTNGKGTTSALCEQMLRECGVRVGLFTSPHLHVFRERIRIDGALVSREAVVSAMASVRAASLAVGGASPFEKLTALALVCFDVSGVEWAVLETGLGGRWDATNHLTPAVCGICKIGFDHMDVLGSTLREIAGEKAGIIKPGIPVFSVSQEEEASAVLRAAAAAAGADLTLGEALPAVSPLPAWLAPPHQAHNAALATALVRSLMARGLLPGNETACARALAAARWPARLELLHPSHLNGTPLLLDVAHNQPAIRALVQSVADAYSSARVVVVLGANKDKDLAAVVRELGALGSRLVSSVAVASSHPKATPAAEVAKIGRGGGGAARSPWLVAGSMLEGLDLAGEALGAGEDQASSQLVLCCGSVFVAAEMREALARAEPTLFSRDDWAHEEPEPPLVM